MTADYSYDADEIRSQKTVAVRNGTVTTTTTHNYLTQSGKVVWETIGSGTTAKVLDFIYDESGKPFALKYSTDNGSTFKTYYYVLNLQGDVVKLVTSSGTAVATYTYDAWGNILNATGTMANINPLRYRGYYYDTETGFYYLQSRYYDPANHRFINADVYASTDSTDAISCDMFAYCGNNPVIASDETGEFWHIVVGAVVGAVTSAISTYVTGGTIEEVLISAACGAASGGLCAAFPGASMAIDAAFSAVETVALGIKRKESAAKIISDTVISVGFSVVTSGGSSVLTDKNTYELLDSGRKSIKTAYRPVLKKQAKKAYKNLAWKTAKTVFVEAGEWIVTEALAYGVSEYKKAYFNYVGIK